MLGRSDIHHRPDGTRGQALVEFALIAPLLMVLFMSVFETAVAFAVNIDVKRAAQGGAHMASQAGDIVGADCLILDKIEKSIIVPTDRAKIESVRIELTDLSGDTIHATNTWSRSGTTRCTVSDDLTIDLPYSRVSEGYPDTQRCTVLSGCPTMTPARSTVDNIAIVVRYRHDWITPLAAMIPLTGAEAGSGWTFEHRSIFRMEPHL